MTRRACLGRLGAGVLALAMPGRGRAEAARAATAPGRIFLFAGFGGGQNQAFGVYAVDPEAETWNHILEQRREGDGFNILNGARVSPDGTTLAFTRFDFDGEPLGVWACDTRGGDPRRLHGYPGNFQDPLLWSGDGTRMIATRRDFNRPENADKVGHWLVDLADGKARKLPIPEADSILDWAADGRRVLVASARSRPPSEEADNNNLPLFVMGLDGRDARQIDPGGGVAFGQQFSPDGRFVSLTRGPADGSGDLVIEVIGVDDGSRRVVLREREFLVPSQALWSPDGRRLAVVVSEQPRNDKGDRVGGDSGYRLLLIDADGHNPRPLRLPDTRFMRPLDWCRGG
jgi:Tol biopolymer transport system component